MVGPLRRKNPLALRNLRTSRKVDYLLDQVHYLTSLFTKHYFRNDPIEEFETLDLREIVRNVEPRIEENCEQGWCVTVGDGADARSARVHWRTPPVSGRPIFIYHPGAGSIPHNKVVSRIIPPEMLATWNIGTIEAHAHQSLKDFFLNAFDTLYHMQLLFAASIHAFESVSHFAVEHGAPYVAYSGTSLGGLIVSLHMCLFGSADIYMPMLAGLNAHHLFFGGSNRAMSDRPELRGKMECYRRALNFDPLLADAPRRPCFPLLAKHDLLMDYRQSRKTWKDYPISVFDRGHASGVMMYHVFSEHILTHLPTY